MIASTSVMFSGLISQRMIVLLAAFAVAAAPVYAKPKPAAKKKPAAAQKVPDEAAPSAAKGPEGVAKQLVGKKLGFWVSGIAKISTYAFVQRGDARNRVMCLLTMTFGTECFFCGDDRGNMQLVHVKRDGDQVEVKEVEEIDKNTGGVYVLFMPDDLYVLDFDANSHVHYAKR